MIFFPIFYTILGVFVLGASLSAAESEESLSNEILEFLASAEVEQLPFGLQRMVRAAGDNMHWCCRVPTTKLVVNSHGAQKYIHISHRRKYYRKCGTWGWGRCSTYQVYYNQGVAYHAMYRSSSIAISCPTHHATCCQGYILVAKHCLSLVEVTKYKQDLLKLQNMGMLG
ncbi:uncharacterized protein LOC141900486 [Tubulanus polymorphus]|uniref:uncharacterized protein LOC141900486 n=1 Tax=Tubulanus polymorphus TaxID=672921 RepID=UPI003DA6215F